MNHGFVLCFTGMLMVTVIIGNTSCGWIDDDRRNAKIADSVNKEIRSHIGEDIVLRKDTFVIVDVNFWAGTYTLSNGTTINWNYPSIRKHN